MGRLEPTDSSPSPHNQHDPPTRNPPPPPILTTNKEHDPDSPVSTSPRLTYQPDQSKTATIHDDQPQGISPPLPPPHEPDPNTTSTTTTIHDGMPQSSSPTSPKPTPPPPHHDETESAEAVPFPPLAHPETARPGPSNDNHQIVLYSPPPPTHTNQHQANGHHDEITLDSPPAVQFPPQGPVPHKPVANDQMANQQMVAVPQVLPDGTVKHQQPQKGQPQVIIVPFVGNPWTSGLFDCMQHPRNAILTTVAPCVTFGQIAEILDNGSTSCLTGAMLYSCLFLVLCHWNVGVRYRTRMRGAFQLAETPVTDKIAHTLFPLCALCQEFRELKDRGYDPFLGYQGVIARIIHDQKQQLIVNAPPPNQTMHK